MGWCGNRGPSTITFNCPLLCLYEWIRTWFLFYLWRRYLRHSSSNAHQWPLVVPRNFEAALNTEPAFVFTVQGSKKECLWLPVLSTINPTAIRHWSLKVREEVPRMWEATEKMSRASIQVTGRWQMASGAAYIVLEPMNLWAEILIPLWPVLTPKSVPTGGSFEGKCSVIWREDK